MHPTLNAMVAAERELEIVRAAERRSHVVLAASPSRLGPAPVTRAHRGSGPVNRLAAAQTALAQWVSRAGASPRGGTRGPEVCCA